MAEALQLSVSWEHNPDHSCRRQVFCGSLVISLSSLPVMKRICWYGRSMSPSITSSNGSRSFFIVLTNMCHLLVFKQLIIVSVPTFSICIIFGTFQFSNLSMVVWFIFSLVGAVIHDAYSCCCINLICFFPSRLLWRPAQHILYSPLFVLSLLL